MRTLDELINLEEHAWPQVQEWLAAASNPVGILPTDRASGERTLLGLQVTTRSPMGAVALESGGIFFDHGWLRFLGASSPRIRGGLLEWNNRPDGSPLITGALIVAHDAVGGFFALNGGVFSGEPGSSFYFSPDTLGWEDLGVSYSQLLDWAATGDLETFYQEARWPGWREDVARLDGDQGFSIYPPLWANAATPMAERSRRAVSLRELWEFQQEQARQL